ncbi:hypothetical protein [Nostoc sp.]
MSLNISSISGKRGTSRLLKDWQGEPPEPSVTFSVAEAVVKIIPPIQLNPHAYISYILRINQGGIVRKSTFLSSMARLE